MKNQSFATKEAVFKTDGVEERFRLPAIVFMICVGLVSLALLLIIGTGLFR